MTTVGAIYTILAADTTLLATATGGVWNFDTTGRNGINRTDTPSAFDSFGIIKPCVLVRLRSSNPDYRIADDANQLVSVREMVECYFFEDNDYTHIETMKTRVYALLHAKQVSGPATVRWAGDVRSRRDLVIDANYDRSDYLCILIRKV